MDLKAAKIKLKKAFSKDIKKAIELLEAHLSDESSHLDTCINLTRNYNEVKRREMQNRITYDEQSREMSHITHSFLSLIELLEEEDIRKAIIQKKIEKQLSILFLTPKSENILTFESFFKTFDFTNTDIQLLNQPKEVQQYDIIIFDNQDLPAENDRNLSESQKRAIQERSQLMNETLINSEHSYIIHLGNTLFWLNNHRDRCNAANSKFTLHSNIKNLIEFIESYQA